MRTFACLSALLILTSWSTLLAGDEPAKTKPTAKPGKKGTADPLAKYRVRCWNDSKVELTLIVTRVVGLDGKTDTSRRQWVIAPGKHTTLHANGAPLCAKQFDAIIKTADGESTWLFADNSFRKDGEMLMVFTDETLKKHTQKLATNKKQPAAQGKSPSPFEAIAAAALGSAVDGERRKSEAAEQEASKPELATSAPPTYPRKWRDKAGKELFNGEWYVFVELKDGDVTLRRHQKRDLEVVPISKLSERDRCFAEPATTSKHYLERGKGRLADRLFIKSVTDERDLELTRSAVTDLQKSVSLDHEFSGAHHALWDELANSRIPSIRDPAAAQQHYNRMTILIKAETKARDLKRLDAFKGKPAPAGWMRSKEGALVWNPTGPAVSPVKIYDFRGPVEASRIPAPGPFPTKPFDSCRWTGVCDEEGYAQGHGVVVWYQKSRPVVAQGGKFAKGRPDGIEFVFDPHNTNLSARHQINFHYPKQGECYRLSKKIDWDLQRTSDKGKRDDSVAAWTKSAEGAKVWTSLPVKNAKCSWSGSTDDRGYAFHDGIVVWEVDGEITQVSFGNAVYDGRFMADAYYLNSGGALSWEEREMWLEAPVGEKPYQLVYPADLVWLERKEQRIPATPSNRGRTDNASSLTPGDLVILAGVAVAAIKVGKELMQDAPRSAVEQNRSNIKNDGYQPGAAVKSADYGGASGFAGAFTLGRGWEGWVVERINAKFVRVKIENAGPHSRCVAGKTYDMAEAEITAY